MKTREVIGSGNFSSLVESAVSELYPDGDGELAALVVRNEEEFRSVLVATPLGVLECSLDLAEPLDSSAVSRPLRTPLVRWDEWPHTSLTAVTYAADPDSIESEWHIMGIDDFATTGRPSRRAKEITAFGRACIERQLGLSTPKG